MGELKNKRVAIVISLIVLAIIIGIAVYLNSDKKAGSSSQEYDSVSD